MKKTIYIVTETDMWEYEPDTTVYPFLSLGSASDHFCKLVEDAITMAGEKGWVVYENTPTFFCAGRDGETANEGKYIKITETEIMD